MLGVAITLPTTTITTVPIHRHAHISPYMRTCKSPPSPFGKSGLCNQDCRLQAESPTNAGKPGRELVLLLLGIDLIGVDELVQQLVEGGHVLVDDAVAILGLGRGADHLLIGVEVMTRGARAEQDVVGAIRGEDHLQQLGEVFLVGDVLGVLEDVEEVVLLQAVAELLDGLGADAVDAEQVLLGLANQVTDDLDADLAELVCLLYTSDAADEQ